MYINASPVVHKVVHQQMAVLIKTIGMGSPQLLQLVASCPKGGENFVFQILRILTESTRPTPPLVAAVQAAYKRLLDARLLIPILGGLEKENVFELLPKLIVLSKQAVRAVISKLAVGPAPLTCTELLVALHLIDVKEQNVSLQRVVDATQYCLDMGSVFKQDVMAVVISQLSSSPNLPPLFMRTVLQTLKNYPKLTGYVVEILLTLIPRQIWTDKKLWEGFIRCCQTAKPTSFKVYALRNNTHNILSKNNRYY